MATEDALACLEALDAMAAYLPAGTSFTLDHEPMSHPELPRILHAAAHTRHIMNYHHGMTTGIGLLRRSDREAVAEAYFQNAYDRFGITIHGSPAHHNEIVRRKGAYEASVEAAKFLKAQGGKIEVSLMLNRHFSQDADQITALLDALAPDFIGFTVPIFTPIAPMAAFEPYRATLHTLYALQGHLARWRQDEEAILKSVMENTPAAVATRFRQGLDLTALFLQPQEELYLTVHPDCKLYMGNSGSETRCLGDLRTLPPEETAAIIRALPGNRDYGTFYDLKPCPPPKPCAGHWTLCRRNWSTETSFNICR